MNSLIRISCVVNRVQVANPKVCANSMLDAIEQIQNLQPAIVVFPALSLCGASCGFLFHNQTLLDNCMEFLDELCLKTQQMNAYVLAGLPIGTAGQTSSVIAVILRGKLLGFLSAGDAPGELSRQYPEKMLCKDSVFACGDLRFSVVSCAPDQLWRHANDPCVQNSDLVVVPSFSPVVAGYTSQVRQMVQAFSQSTGKAVALCNGGLGETSSPRIYKGFAGIYEQGREMAFEACESETVIATCDLDSDIIHSGQKRVWHHTLCEPVACLDELGNPKGLYRNILKSPYLENRDISDYLEELFDLQVQSLYNRLENTGIKRVVLGISGGLDSTLALLVAHKAMQRLELDETNIIGITMPGFGTTDRTYYNALKLLEELGVTSMDIPIRRKRYAAFCRYRPGPQLPRHHLRKRPGARAHPDSAGHCQQGKRPGGGHRRPFGGGAGLLHLCRRPHRQLQRQRVHSQIAYAFNCSLCGGHEPKPGGARHPLRYSGYPYFPRAFAQ